MFFPPSFECTGRSRGLSVPRAFLADFIHFARKMPLVAVSRRMDLGPVVAARKAVTPSPNWVLLFAKAFARVAADRPELRRAFMTFPWTHFYECDQSVAAIAVEREYAGEPMVLFALFRNPHETPLAELAGRLHEFKTKPLESLEPLHRTIRITKLPKLVRRALWVHALYQSGRIKAQNFGTFGISSVAVAGATTVGMASLLTNTLSLGPFDESGHLDVRLDFDHRVYDGVPAAKALAEVERVLRTEIVAELQTMAPPTRTE
ncbi:hypothetical protein [Limnoglobus roseus]|uniref:2-oxoacid dehydrogenase acyltransferase catalytic domain-containing protein n=1 Tax=Limnoglobus roseus TaxID=2598579 RepID=A0A5C1AAE8_9BACT|nr:hypothetical protein [Limnoglobus roseus]QEL15700.1 hypothetical protein PX52LOC_02635 [Limnoglobus roseus]